MRAVTIVAVSILGATLPAGLASAQTTKPDTLAEAFRARLHVRVPTLLEETLVPGAAVALLRNGEVVWITGHGYADLERRTPVEPSTVFNIGSISKTVAAWGVMRLVEEDRIDLDAPVEIYLTRWHLPSSEFDHDGVTMRRLLSHTAGLRLHGYPGFRPDEPLPSLEASLSGATNGSGDVRLVIEPGTEWRYSGGGYTLAQLVVEEVTGERFEDYMRRAVLRPLGMRSSHYDWTDEIEARAATPYGTLGEPVVGPRFTAAAAAGLQTTAEDLAVFVAAGLHPRLLMEETLRLMQRPANHASLEYGLGYGIFDSNGVTMVGHEGANTGWMAFMAMVPTTGDGLVVLTNGSNGDEVHQQITCLWRKMVSESTGDCLPGIGSVVLSTTVREGINAAVRRYRELRETDPDGYDFAGRQLNRAGYALLRAGRTTDAIRVFQLNVEMFPEAFNAYDSLGEAYMEAGERERAIANYEKSLELNPENENAAEMLRWLREGSG